MNLVFEVTAKQRHFVASHNELYLVETHALHCHPGVTQVYVGDGVTELALISPQKLALQCASLEHRDPGDIVGNFPVNVT